MAPRRRSARLKEPPKRRSLRLAKVIGYENSPTLEVVTPRTVFRKVLQTQPIVSPVVPVKTNTPKPVETVFKFPTKNAADSNLEVSLTGPVPEETFHPVLRKRGQKKKVRLSEFERAVDKQLASTTAKSFLDNTSLTRSLQITLGTPVTPPSDGKRGLLRRPKSYKGVNVMTFERGIEQNLLQIKGSAQNHLVDLHASVLSNATETIYASTELFAQSQLSGLGKTRLHDPPSELASARKSSSLRIMISSAAGLQTPEQHAQSDADAGTTWQNQKEISVPETKCVDGKGGVPKQKAGSPSKEQQKSELAIEGGMMDSNLKELLLPDTASGVDVLPQQRALSPGEEQQESLHGQCPVEQQGSLHGDHPMEQEENLHGDRPMEQEENLHGDRPMEQEENLHGNRPTEQEENLHGGRPMEQEENLHGDRPTEQVENLHGDHLTEELRSLHGDRLMDQLRSLYGDQVMEQLRSPFEHHLKLHSSHDEEHHLSDISALKPSMPVDTESPAVLGGGLRAFMQLKSTKRSVKATVEHIIEELDKNMAPCVMGQGVPKIDLEEEPFPSKGGHVAAPISQSNRIETPGRSVSRQEAEQVEGEATDEAIQQSGDKSKPTQVSDLEGEADVISEVEMDSEIENVSEAEMDSENDEPLVKTPAFVRRKAFQCTPLLSTPHTQKSAASKPASKQPSKKHVPRESKKAHREKRQPGISTYWVKKTFSHFAKMPVTKEAFQAVERCISLYFKHLSDDLETYANHARRKTIESADMELLMRRQGLITDKIDLNVLIERHLPLEYRKLLIPIATSGNKVIPFNPR